MQSRNLLINRKKDLVGISPHSVISETAKIGSHCYTGDYVVVGDKCKIGDNTIIYDRVSLVQNCHIGNNCVVQLGVTMGGIRLENLKGFHILEA